MLYRLENKTKNLEEINVKISHLNAKFRRVVIPDRHSGLLCRRLKFLSMFYFL